MSWFSLSGHSLPQPPSPPCSVCECRASSLHAKLSSLAEPTWVSRPQPTSPECFHSSSSGACMKIARVPQATTAASGNQLGHSGRKTNSALAGDLGCPGSQLGCLFWPQTTCSGAQRRNGQEETPWSQILCQSWVCHIVPSL